MIQDNNSVLNFEDLFRSLGTAYIVFDVNDPEFTIIEENEAHAAIAMVKREDVIGKPLLEAFPDTSEKYMNKCESQFLKSIRRVIATGKPDRVSDLNCDLKDQKGILTTKFWEVTHYPIFEGDTVRAVCQQTNDTTQSVLSRRELSLANRAALEGRVRQRTLQLEKTNQGLQDEITRRHKLDTQRLQHYIDVNKTKDEFISLASHQLRTPATGVKQYLGMVLEGMAGDFTEAQQALLQKAYESNERQLTIVSDLLKVAQIDAGKVRLRRKEVNITELLTDVIKEQEDTYAMRKQVLQFTAPPFKPMAFVDPDKMRMVLENMLDNASKYSEPGKSIRVVLTEEDDTIVVAIHDRGVGIARNDMTKLFGKFNRIHNHLSNHVGGTGLGLYWAKEMVDLHGGAIKVTSVLGKGSTFSVYLPKNEKIPVKTVINGGVYEQ